MNILALNISVIIMIVLTLLVNRLKGLNRYICAMWAAVIIRMFIPLTIDSKSSFWNISMKLENRIAKCLRIKHYVPISDILQNGVRLTKNEYIFWAIIALLLALLFIAKYVQTYIEVKNAPEIKNNQWLKSKIEEQNFRRKIVAKSMNVTHTAATFGIIRPVIVFPADFDFQNRDSAQLILLHEFGHIRYFHSLYTILTTALVCLYWYNPFVWILYLSIDKNLEIAADRYVLDKSQGDKRAEYATLLLSAATAPKKTVFYYHYKNKTIKERIEQIMNYKKLSIGAMVVSVLLPACMVPVFATTDAIITGKELEKTEIVIEAVEYGDPVPQMNDIALELDWSELEPYASESVSRAPSSYDITDYKYVTYGSKPPKTITVTTTKNGYKYKGTLSLNDIEYEYENDKYTGYYSGTVYRQ